MKVKAWNLEISQDSQIGTLSLDLTGAVRRATMGHVDRPDADVGGDGPDLHRGPARGQRVRPPRDEQPADQPLPVHQRLEHGRVGRRGFLDMGFGRWRARHVPVGRAVVRQQLRDRFWANRFVQFSQFCGRDLKLTAQNFYSNSPDDRTTFEGLTAQSISFSIGNGTHSVTFVMNTNNILTSVEDHLPLDDVYTQTLTATSQYDRPTPTRIRPWRRTSRWPSRSIEECMRDRGGHRLSPL